MKAGGQAAVSGDVARGEAVPRLPHAPAGLKIPLRPLLAQARRPLLPPVAQHCPPHGRQLLPSPCFQKPPRPRRYLGCSIPRRSRADCCRRAGSPATVLEPPPQPQLPVSSCRQPSWRASATERPPRRPRQAFGYVLGRPCPRPESTRKSTRKSTRSHYCAERAPFGKIRVVVVSNSRFAPEAQCAVGPIDTCIWCRRHLSNNPGGGRGV